MLEPAQLSADQDRRCGCNIAVIFASAHRSHDADTLRFSMKTAIFAVGCTPLLGAPHLQSILTFEGLKLLFELQLEACLFTRSEELIAGVGY
jgi:hypothetical protein